VLGVGRAPIFDDEARLVGEKIEGMNNNKKYFGAFLRVVSDVADLQIGISVEFMMLRWVCHVLSS